MWKKTMVLISGGFFCLLLFIPTLSGIIETTCFMLFLLTVTALCREWDSWLKQVPKRWFEAVIIHIVLLVRFCIILNPSSSAARLAAFVGLSSGQLLLIFSTLAAILAIPFTSLFVGALVDYLKTGNTIPVKKPIAVSRWQMCVIVCVLCMTILVICSFNLDVWCDEAFSLRLKDHSFREIITLTAADVHPPLYYLILKTTTSVFSVFGSEVVAGKLTSVLAYVLLLVIGSPKIRYLFGEAVAGLWMICVVGMSSCMHYGIEIRMYAWALLFVTLTYLFANDIVLSKSGRSPWIKFTLCGICAAYTHYYACVSVGVICLVLFLWFWMNDRHRMKQLIIACAAMGTAFVPWLLVLMRQFNALKEDYDYWIQMVTIQEAWDGVLSMFGSSVLALFCAYLCIRKRMEKEEELFHDWDSIYAVGGIIVPFGTMLIGILASLAIRPVFYSRYLFPGLSCMWLGMLLLCRNRPVAGRLMSFFVLFFSLLNVGSFIETEYNAYRNDVRIRSFLAQNSNAVYISDSSRVVQTLSVMTDNNVFLWGGELEAVYIPVHGNIQNMYDASEMMEYLNAGKKVFFADYLDSTGVSRGVEDLIGNLHAGYRDMGNFAADRPVQMYEIFPADSP